MIEMRVDPDIILGRVQRKLGELNIDNQGVNDKSCPRFEKHAGLQVARSAQAQLAKIFVFVQVSNQARMLSLAIDGRDPSAKKINGHRGVRVSHLLDI